MPRTALFALPLFAAMLVLAVALIAGPAAAQDLNPAPGWHPTPIPVAQKKRRPQADGRKIACRPGGCFRIPYGCYPEVEYDWWGNPTGYDKIVCPRR